MSKLESVINTRLSAVMEALATATTAVAEITTLINDYSVRLCLELSMQKQDNEILKNKLKVFESGQHISLQLGYEEDFERDRLLLNNALQISTLPHPSPDCGELICSEEESFALQGSSLTSASAAGVRDQKATTDFKNEPLLAFVVKQEKLEEDQNPVEELKIKAPEYSDISPVTRHQHPTEKPAMEDQWPQFHSLPAESLENNPHTDYIQFDGEHHNLKHNMDQTDSADSNLKREPGSQYPKVKLVGEHTLELHQGAVNPPHPDCRMLPQGNSSTDRARSGCSLVTIQENQHTNTMVGGVEFSSHNGHQRGSRDSRTSCYKAKEWRFACEDCGKCFPYLSVLRRHTPMHTGERPHLCGVCGRSFIRKSHLRRHEKLHAKHSPFHLRKKWIDGTLNRHEALGTMSEGIIMGRGLPIQN